MSIHSYAHHISTADPMKTLVEKVARIEETQMKILDLLHSLEELIANSGGTTSCSNTMALLASSSPRPRQFQINTTPACHSSSCVQPRQLQANSAGTPNADQLPLPLGHNYGNKPLPSSEIDKSNLIGADFILRSKAKSCKPGTLAQLLARESFFGEALMARCTPGGTKDLPALPKQEMFELKKTVFSAFPEYTMEMFESEWRSKCWPAIEQACGHLRRAAKK